jgi:signal transduction histidine kinase
VTNTGTRIHEDQVPRLFEPFQRLAADRTSRQDGHHGLGLSIVQAIANAHDATIVARGRGEGGLEIEVNFPHLETSALDARVTREVTPSMTSV